MARKKSKSDSVVMLIVLQGRPQIIQDDDGEPHRFASMDEAREFTTGQHSGIQAAESIFLLDFDSGELDMF